MHSCQCIGDVRNLLINTPPGSSKTELAVIAFMAWCFARDPHCRFLHLSYSDDLARSTARQPVRFWRRKPSSSFGAGLPSGHQVQEAVEH